MPKVSTQDMAVMSGTPHFTQIGGTGKGRIFEFRQKRLSIGRTEDNEIMLPHESVSRVHAYVESLPEGGWGIYDNQSKNGVIVNGEAIEAAQLENNDVIQIGIFSFRFQTTDEAIASSGEPHAIEVAYSDAPSEPPRMKRGVNKRVLIYGTVGLVIAYIVMNVNSEETKTEKSADKTKVVGFGGVDRPAYEDTSPNAKIPGLKDPAITKVEEELSRIDPTDTSLREAEQYFRRGQRDFSNKNYQRAIEAFSTAYAINRKHPLAEFYLRDAIAQSQNEAEEHRNAAIKYFESLQYARAIYHFREAIRLMGHAPDHPFIKQCEKSIELAKQKLQASEMYP